MKNCLYSRHAPVCESVCASLTTMLSYSAVIYLTTFGKLFWGVDSANRCSNMKSRRSYDVALFEYDTIYRNFGRFKAVCEFEEHSLSSHTNGTKRRRFT